MAHKVTKVLTIEEAKVKVDKLVTAFQVIDLYMSSTCMTQLYNCK